MALQNRVTPLGELIAVPERGLVYGNRGCLHDRDGRIRRSYAVKRWIACRVEFKNRRRKALLITPPTTVDVLRAGWTPVVPFVHPSAFSARP